MIAFLTWVTVVYAVVLVVVLAVSLIAIFYYLWSIGTTLSQISAGLAVVRQQTAPLGGQIGAINSALTSVGNGLGESLEDLVEVNVALAGMVGAPADRAVVRVA